MYKLIIADDEKWVLKGLKAKIDFSRFELDIVAEAEDGDQLLALTEEYAPDMIISDIRMNGPDGLTCFEKIAQKNPSVQLIVISGYEDFSYAKRALRVNAVGYILKPVDKTELNDTIGKAIERLQKNRIYHDRLLSMKTMLSRAWQTLLRDDFNYTQISELSPILVNRCAAVLILSFPDLQVPEYALVTDTVEHCQAGKGCLLAAEKTGNTFVVIAVMDQKSQLSEIATRLLYCLQKALNLEVGVFAGKAVDSIYDIKKSYDQARELLSQGRLSYSGRVMVYESPVSSSVIEFPQSLETELLQSLDASDKSVTLELCSRFIRYYADQNQCTMKELRNGVSILISDITKLLYEKSCGNALINSTINMKDQNHQCSNALQVEKNLVEGVELICDELISSRQDIPSIVSQITKLIQAAPEKEYSLSCLSDRYHISESYLSLSFKKITGINLQNYITGARIEKAKKLLSETRLSVKKISILAGYEDSSYFGKVFHRETGLTPKEYRLFFKEQSQ